jgi:hypothetical protein
LLSVWFFYCFIYLFLFILHLKRSTCVLHADPTRYISHLLIGTCIN